MATPSCDICKHLNVRNNCFGYYFECKNINIIKQNVRCDDQGSDNCLRYCGCWSGVNVKNEISLSNCNCKYFEGRDIKTWKP